MLVGLDKFKREALSLIAAIVARKPAFENFVDILQVLLNIIRDHFADFFRVTLFADQVTDWQSRMSDPERFLEQFDLLYQSNCGSHLGCPRRLVSVQLGLPARQVSEYLGLPACQVGLPAVEFFQPRSLKFDWLEKEG